MKIKYLPILLTLLALTTIATAEQQTEYYAVFMEGAKIGHAAQTRTIEAGKVTTQMETKLSISRMGVAIDMAVTEITIETEKGKPIGFSVEQDMGMMLMKSVGVINNDGTMTVKNLAMGSEQNTTSPWPKDALMAEGFRLLTLKKGLQKGTAYSVKLFVPSLMQTVESHISIGDRKPVDLLGRVVMLHEVKSTMTIPMAGAITETLYVDDESRMLKSTTSVAGMQMELLACTKEFALSDNDVYEFASSMFVDSPEPIKNVNSAKSIAYVLKPKAGATDLPIPQSDNQRVKKLDDGSVIVAVEPVTESKSSRIPYKGTDQELTEAIKPNRFLQCDDARIIALAKQAAGNIKDAGQAARNIEAFVAGYIDQFNLSVGYASAVEIAETKKGDCTEFAVLTATLCRAIGIPARVAVGVAYVDDFMGYQGFGGHAWNEVYIGDKWVGLDAAFKAGGRGGYNAGRITLAIGDGEPAAFLNLANTLGQFEITKVIVAPK